MTPELSIALLAAIPPTLAAVLAFASSRSVKRSVGSTNGSLPLSRMVEILDGKIERQSQDLARLGERQSKLEERLFWHLVAGGGAE